MIPLWIKNEYNVYMEGMHGVGKTAVIKEGFLKSGLNLKYFSAATMDPWVDFIGVPREVDDEAGMPYLELIRPKDFRDDNIDAIFIDEFNRAPKKVRNAVMELLQFKSINGRKFENLKMVWAAVNPDDGNYDTEAVDPAQKDRFQIHVKVPYELNQPYLTRVYGNEVAAVAVEWWDELTPELKALVSPRRLDYALDAIKRGLDVRGFILPETTGVAKLVAALTKGPVMGRFKKIFDDNDVENLKKMLKDENDWTSVKKHIINNDEHIGFVLPHLDKEKQMAWMSESQECRNFITTHRHPEKFKDVLNAAANSYDPKIKNMALGILSRIHEKMLADGNKSTQKSSGGSSDDDAVSDIGLKTLLMQTSISKEVETLLTNFSTNEKKEFELLADSYKQPSKNRQKQISGNLIKNVIITQEMKDSCYNSNALYNSIIGLNDLFGEWRYKRIKSNPVEKKAQTLKFLSKYYNWERYYQFSNDLLIYSLQVLDAIFCRSRINYLYNKKYSMQTLEIILVKLLANNPTLNLAELLNQYSYLSAGIQYFVKEQTKINANLSYKSFAKEADTYEVV